MIRCLFDTSVLVSARLSPTGAPAQLLRRWLGGELELVVSPLLLQELTGVLVRPKFERYITREEVDAFVELLRASALVADDPAGPPAVCADPDDDYVVAIVVDAKAHALVTGDAHLLDLRGRIPARVVTPREMIDLLDDA